MEAWIREYERWQAERMELGPESDESGRGVTPLRGGAG